MSSICDVISGLEDFLHSWASHANCQRGTFDDDSDGVAPLTTVVVFENRGGANTLCVCRLCRH